MRKTRRCAGLLRGPVPMKINGQEIIDQKGRTVLRYKCVRSENCPVHKAENENRRKNESMILVLPFDQQVPQGNIVTDREEIRRLVNAGYFQITGRNLYPEFDINK